jgi:predicted RNA-binding Zn-ribbon protein involved in translation (DUF1610 family)
MVEKYIPEDSVPKDELPGRARFKCPECGAYFLNKQTECTGFGGDPGDDSKAHRPTLSILNPDRTDWSS